MKHSIQRSICSTRSVLLLGMALFLCVLAACGTNAVTGTGNAGPEITATASAGSPTPLATARSTNTPTKLPAAQNCGTVYAMRPLTVPTGQDRVQEVEQCFWQAYQQCRPATMRYSQASVDTATIHTFAIRRQNGGCVVSDTLEHVIEPRTVQPAGSYTCAGLRQQIDGLYFLACGQEGTILVPAAGTQ